MGVKEKDKDKNIEFLNLIKVEEQRRTRMDYIKNRRKKGGEGRNNFKKIN